MEWTGIQNENEYYSAYFLSEGLADSLKDQLKTWHDEEEARRAVAEAKGEEWVRTPGREIRHACRALLDDMEVARRQTKLADRLEVERGITARLLKILGLPAVNPADEPFYVAGNDHLPLPLIGALYRDGKKTEPVLWIFEATPTVNADVEQTSDTDPLEMFVQTGQFTEDTFDLPASARKELEDNWNRLLEKRVFSVDYPPRWVILAAAEHWVLIDRTKFNRHSVLRFDWKEIFTRREDRVMDVCAALLSAESMVGRDGATVLLDRVDEDAHKQAYGVSESLKKSLREAIELLGNEAANKIIEKARQQKKTVKRDATFAEELTVECLRYMYRVLFLLFIEARPDLKYAPIANDVYQSGYAFEGLRDIESRPLLTDEDRQGRFFHDSINLLVTFFAKGTSDKMERLTGSANKDVVHGMTQVFGINAFKGSLFDLSKTPNLNKIVFSNETLQQVVRLMSLSETQRGRGRKQGRGRISYAHLGIHQLGAVYEALLSYRGFFAQEDLYEVSPDPSKRDEFQAGYFVTKAEIDSGHYTDDQKVYEMNDFGERVLKTYPKGSFIYRLTGREREKSASYYTPEILTQCLVKYVLKEYWETVIDKLPDDKAKAERILKLKIAEPALGSATFLNEAINQLAAKYMEHAQKAAGERLSQERYNDELQRVKMYLADNNVFGVDLNPVAVELAQVSLWLNALSSDKFVPWFGLQLQCGNSLIGCRRRVCKVELVKKKYVFSNPYELKGRDRAKDEIWQFMLPDLDMMNYSDSDMKAVYATEFDALKEKRKAFNQPWTKEEVEQALWLSEMVDQHWDAWAEELAVMRGTTTDPYDIYGHKAEGHDALSYEDKNALAEKTRLGDGSVDTGHFTRLRTAMDYWCSLWFWPIKEADHFPSRADYFADMSAILASEVYGIEKLEDKVSAHLFSALEAEEAETFKEDESGSLIESELDANARLHIARQVSERLRFFHWPLRFADILYKTPDGSPVGFDITLGNPPWRVASWNSSAVIGDFLPYILFRKESASTLRSKLLEKVDHRRWIDTQEQLSFAWRTEYEEAAGTQNFCGSAHNYPELDKCRMDLFKVFLPLTWSNATEEGVIGFVHPMTVFTETNGERLRKQAYQRARYIFQFKNETSWFPIGHRVQFLLGIYGKESLSTVDIQMIMNLFHPKAIDESFASDGSGEVEGIKDSNGNWSVKGHKDRVMHLNSESMKMIAKVFATSETAPVLPNLHCEALLRILEKFGHAKRRLSDIKDLTISSMWNETVARVDGTIREFPKLATKKPASFDKLILNGPHLFVGNPLFKTPRNPCTSHGAWTPIDLEAIPDDFVPRHKYEQACDDEVYDARQVKCDWDVLKVIKTETNEGVKEEKVYAPFDRHWRIVYREMVPVDGERTLTSAIYPPSISWINTVNGIATKDDSVLLSLAASFASLPMDAVVRQLGKGHLLPTLMGGLPFVDYGSASEAAYLRVLGLNCLTQTYAPIWLKHYKNEWNQDKWTLTNNGLNPEWFSALTAEWNRNIALRSDLSRRQALVELDVLTAHALTLTLRELQILYRMRFVVMREYDQNTWYDQNGRIVFTTNKGLSNVGLPRVSSASDHAAGITYTINGTPCTEKGLGFEDVKDMKEGTITKTFPDDSMTDGEPVMRTVTYKAPFFRMDREKDYETAWREFGKRFGWTDLPEESPSAENTDK